MEEGGIAAPPTPEKLRASDVLVTSTLSPHLEILGLQSDDDIEQEMGGEEEIVKDIFSWLPLEELYEEPLPLAYKDDVDVSFGSSNGLTDSSDLNVRELEFEEFKLKLEEEESILTSVDSPSKSTIDNDVAFFALRIVWDWQRQKSRNNKLQLSDDDLVSESDVELGEGSVQESDYPYSDYEHDLDDEEFDFDRLPAHLQQVLRLPLDEVPSEYLEFKLSRRRERTYEEEAFYRHVVLRTKGFECPSFPERRLGFGSVAPYSYEKVHGSHSITLEGYCNQAIAEYNHKKGTLYKLKYLIKAVGNFGVDNITFALTDENYKPYVGRVSVTFAYTHNPPPVVREMRVTRGEYRAPNWKDATKQEYVCKVNEVFRQKLPELEKNWKQKMHLI